MVVKSPDRLENENNLVKTKLGLGSSGTNAKDIASSNIGALDIDKYLALGKGVLGTREPVNPWLHAFQYFSNMAAEASKPGATALGAAGQAGNVLAKSLIEEHKAKRAEELAGAGLGIKLATALGKPKTFKQYPTGDTATYMTKVNAKQYLINKGMSPDAPTFDSIVKRLTAPTESMVGKPVIIADSFQAIAPVVKGDTIVDVNFTAIPGQKPPNVFYREKRIPILAKAEEYTVKTFDTLQRVEQALVALRTGEIETGGLTNLTLDFRRIFGQLFGTTDPELQNLQLIESISNVLAPQMRPKGSGSTSDMEFKAYQRAIADLGNTPKANYISLYTFKKVQENSTKAIEKEIEILSAGGGKKDVRAELDKIDKGIYAKYTGKLPPKEVLSKSDATKEIEATIEFETWFDALPTGTVVFNRDVNNKVLMDDFKDELFIIKGWGGEG